MGRMRVIFNTPDSLRSEMQILSGTLVVHIYEERVLRGTCVRQISGLARRQTKGNQKPLNIVVAVDDANSTLSPIPRNLQKTWFSCGPSCLQMMVSGRWCQAVPP